MHYLHQSLPREELAAFYVAADVMTVTPLRDGMNLVAKEYVACRVDGGGVLLLSEFTGAAKEMRAGLLVNPYDTDGVKEACAALTMPAVEPDAGCDRCVGKCSPTTSTGGRPPSCPRWSTPGTTSPTRCAGCPATWWPLSQIAETQRLLVATDFDGCLAPIVDDPATARPLPESMEALQAMTVTPGTVVAVVSGRALADLEMLLGPADRIHLVGSHGAETSAEDREETPLLARRTPSGSAGCGWSCSRSPPSTRRVRLELKPTGIAVHLRAWTPTTRPR